MPKQTHLPATTPANGGALASTTGPQRIATRMADDLLNVARSRERALAARRRYRIGEYEFREADHEQVQRWARMLGMKPEAVVEGLAKMQKKRGKFSPVVAVEFRVENGCIVSLAWDFGIFPLADWDWVGGLNLAQLGITGTPQNGKLPTLPRCLRELICYSSQLTDLDLTPVPGLTELYCSHNQLTDLDLTPVPELTTLNCSSNPLTNLDLSPVPGLTELYCGHNQLTDLDLTPVPGLTKLYCGDNLLAGLDLTPVPGLRWLSCDKDAHLTGAPHNLKVTRI